MISSFIKKGNPIEKMFDKLKHFRSVATRYDKLAITFLAFLDGRIKYMNITRLKTLYKLSHCNCP
ncbi:hypothetical protein MIDIC_510008 [Alphaproteobacteria bacterium]